VGFANSHIAAFGKEATGAQFLEKSLINPGLEGEVKVFQPLQVRQTGKAQVGLDDLLTPCGQLGSQQPS
jgi:hypothetical protein